MTPTPTLLVGDIGATRTRLALVSVVDSAPSVLHETDLPSPSFTGLEEPVLELLRHARVRPTRAVFAVAGPVLDGRAALTNLPWVLDEDELRRSLGLSSVRLVNDLVAMADAIPRLGPESLATLQAGRPAPDGTIALVAPGTGLGQAFLTWNGTRYQASPSEGGHADFAPADELQLDLLRWLRARLGHVSTERVCCGRGLPDLYRFLAERGAAPESPAVAERLAAVEDATPVIVAAALDPEHPCPLSRASVELLAAILAAEAGNVALRLLATGGVYLGGGLPRRLLPILQRPAFAERFRDKGRLSPLLARAPLHVVNRPNVGLIGAIQCALSIHDD